MLPMLARSCRLNNFAAVDGVGDAIDAAGRCGDGGRFLLFLLFLQHCPCDADAFANFDGDETFS